MILNGKISLPTYLYPNSLVRMDFRFINLWGLLKQPDLNLICGWMGRGRDLHNATLSVPLKFDPALVLPGGLAKTLLSLTLRVSISVGLRWGPRICISHQFSEDANASVCYRLPTCVYTIK